MEHMVPMRRETWSFFDRQRSTFSSMFKDMDDDFAEFDKELERIRKEMFPLMTSDFGGGFDSMIRPEHPIVKDNDGKQRLSLRFDCKEFKPENITVKTIDNKLMVHGKHLEESPGRRMYREFNRQYLIPYKIDPTTLNSTLTGDGVLSIEAPAPASIEAKKERVLPIKML